MTIIKKDIELPTERAGIFKVGEGVLINKDAQSLNSYKMRKRKMQEIDTIKCKIDELSNDMKYIKEMLSKISTNK